MVSTALIPVSWLSRYVYCPRQLYLVVVEGVKPEEDVRLVKGTVLHKVLESVYKYDAQIVTQVTQAMIKPEFDNLFRDKYLDSAMEILTSKMPALRKVGLRPAEVLETNLAMLKQMAARRSAEVFSFSRALGVYGSELAEKIFPKYETGIFLESKSLRLKGEIDMVERYSDASVPVEIKSSRAPAVGVWPSDQIQLAAYMMLLGDSEHVMPKKGFVSYLPSQKRVQVELNPFLEDEVLHIRDLIIGMIEAKNPPEVPERRNICNDCSMARYCFGKPPLQNQ